MTTLQAIRLLAEQIENVYETVSEFMPSNYESEMELRNGNEALYLYYKDCGNGELSDLRIECWGKLIYVDKWRKIGGFMGVNEELLATTFRSMMKDHYALKIREYNEKHAAEIAEQESEYYKEMYYDNKMCLAMGK
ncbi:hypothetical protein DSECCO2_469420 [anaerobic digester metagenome]|jgi:hypothetical protein